MKVIILAAGCGKRLGLKKPKAIVELWDKKTILDIQVERVRKYIAEKDIYVVVGYKAEEVMKTHPELTYIYNPRYGETNTSKSLLRGMQHIEEENVLWMNGDIVFEEEILSTILASKQSCILVDDNTGDIYVAGLWMYGVLDRETGRFFHLDYETPVEELSGVIAQTDLYHDCFLGFSGKFKVRITHFFYAEGADQVIAVCGADLSLVLNFEKKVCNQYFLYDEHLKIFLQVGPKRDDCRRWRGI